MVKAVWNGEIIAESNETIIVEGTHCFPVSSVAIASLRGTDHTSVCTWKGTASYFTVYAGGSHNENAAWTYKTPSVKAEHIKDRIAFWKGVIVS